MEQWLISQGTKSGRDAEQFLSDLDSGTAAALLSPVLRGGLASGLEATDISKKGMWYSDTAFCFVTLLHFSPCSCFLYNNNIFI